MVSLSTSFQTTPIQSFGKLPDGWRKKVSEPINRHIREPIVQMRTDVLKNVRDVWDNELVKGKEPFALQVSVPFFQRQHAIGSAQLAGVLLDERTYGVEAVLQRPLQTYQAGEAFSTSLSVELVENRAPFTSRPLRLAHIKSAEDLRAIAKTPADNEALDRRLQDLKLSADTQLSMRSLKPESSKEFASAFELTASNGKRHLEWTQTGYKATEVSGPFNSRRLSIEYSETDDTKRWQYYIHTPLGLIRRVEVLEHPDYAKTNHAHTHHESDAPSGKLSVSA